jgi:hypothetical protein
MPLKRAVVTTMLVTAQTNGRIVETKRGMPFGRVSIPSGTYQEVRAKSLSDGND